MPAKRVSTKFLRYVNFFPRREDLAGRVRVWCQATAAAEQLTQEFDAWLAKPDLGRVRWL